MTHRGPLLSAASLVTTLLIVAACGLSRQNGTAGRGSSPSRSLQHAEYTRKPTRTPSPTPDLATRLARRPMPPRNYASLIDTNADKGRVFPTPPTPRSYRI